MAEARSREQAREKITALGLDHAFGASGVGFGFNDLPGGMDQQTGAIVVPNAESREADAPAGLYEPNKQTWIAQSGWKLGWYTERPPRPVDLARAEQFGGHAVILGDGHEWMVCRALMAPGGEPALPQRLELDQAGQWRRTPLERFADFSAKAKNVWTQILLQNGMMDPAEVPADFTMLDDLAAADLAVQALAVHYRIGRVEAAALGLFTTGFAGTVRKVLEAVVDLPTYRELYEALAESKKNARPSTTPPGDD